MAEIIFCIWAGIWLIATGVMYRIAVKREYDTYGVEGWNSSGEGSGSPTENR
mgnify:CR=1 FL=1